MKTILIQLLTLLLVAQAVDACAVTPPAKVAYVEGTVLIKRRVTISSCLHKLERAYSMAIKSRHLVESVRSI